MRVGVLALQGAFAAHAGVLRTLGHEAVEVRACADLRACEALVLPGGESTAQLRLIEREPGLADALDAFVRSGAPALATCAGLILAAREVRDPEQRSFGWIDVSVRRNGWGRQVHSRETIADDGITPVVLIRAPRITRVGEGVSVEATLEGEPIAVRAANVWGATFHPELAGGALHARVLGGGSTRVLRAVRAAADDRRGAAEAAGTEGRQLEATDHELRGVAGGGARA